MDLFVLRLAEDGAAARNGKIRVSECSIFHRVSVPWLYTVYVLYMNI